MNRSDLSETLASKFRQLTTTDATAAVKVILDVVSTTVAKNGQVEIRGFGSFSLNFRPPRKGRNSMTGTSVQVPGKYAPHFKPGKELKDRVNNSGV